jgi:hypothetical protein
MNYNTIEEKAVGLVASGTWDLKVSLQNGFKTRADLPLLYEAQKVATRYNSKTSLNMIEGRIRRLEKLAEGATL